MKRNIVLSVMLLLSCMAFSQSQYPHSAHMDGERQTVHFDLRDMNISPQQFSLLKVRSRHEAPKKGAENVRWIDRIHNLPAYLHDFYDLCGESIQQVLEGKSNWIAEPSLVNSPVGTTMLQKIHTYTGSVDFTFPLGATSEQIKERAMAAAAVPYNADVQEFVSFLPYAMMCVSYDYPEAFWIGNNYSYSYSNSLSWSWGETSGVVTYTLDVYLLVRADGYDMRRSSFRSAENVKEGVKMFNERVAQILEDAYQERTRRDILASLNHKLTTTNYYNPFLSLGTNTDIAWSPLSALAGMEGKDAPVCEGYARAYKVLCDKLDIPCVLASGWGRSSAFDSPEAHMWNEVMMDDESWYAVDVTWNDPSTDTTSPVSGFENEDWFLLGANDPTNGGLSFSQSHLVGGAWGDTSAWEWNSESFIAKDGFVYVATPGENILYLYDASGHISQDTDLAGKAIKYSRTFKNTSWQPLYVPFAMNFDEWDSQGLEVARINGFYEYDDNEDGVIDRSALEVLKVKKGTLYANHPYLIRSKETGRKTIVAEGATLCATKQNAVDCATAETKYTFSGIYTPLTRTDLDAKSAFVMGGGSLKKSSGALNGFRWYMTRENRGGQLLADDIEIKLLVIEEEDNLDAFTAASVHSSAETYNLMGQKVDEKAKGLLIRNGRKYIRK